MVLRLSSMGDVAMALPVLHCLLAQYPNIRLTVVSRPFFEPLFDGLARCDFFAADVDASYKGLRGIVRLAKQLAKLNPDMIADLHGVFRAQLLRRILYYNYGIPNKSIDKERAAKKRLCARKPNKQLRPLKTTHQRYADVFEKLGFSIDLTKPFRMAAWLPSSKALDLMPIGAQLSIGIAPFARYEGKTYPTALMQELIGLLIKTYPAASIYLFGGKADADSLELWAANTPQLTNLAGKLSLRDELACMQQLDLMLSMDSANMHLASMLGIPVVSLWGATHPCLGFYGWGQKPENAVLPDVSLYPTLPCSVNGKKVHPEAVGCMSSISPEVVLAVMRKQLACIIDH